MSIHDIYDANKKKTGDKFSSKANDLRTPDEFSLNVIVFALFEGKILIGCNEDKTSFFTIEDLVEADESSVRAAERIIYRATGLSVEGTDLKLLTTKCLDNNFYDAWLLELDYSNNDIDRVLSNDDIIVISRDTFEKMIENNDFAQEIELSDLDLIFGEKDAKKVRPLIRKSNLY